MRASVAASRRPLQPESCRGRILTLPPRPGGRGGAPISDPARFRMNFNTGRVGDRRSGGRCQDAPTSRAERRSAGVPAGFGCGPAQSRRGRRRSSIGSGAQCAKQAPGNSPSSPMERLGLRRRIPSRLAKSGTRMERAPHRITARRRGRSAGRRTRRWCR